jgi:amidohydrolase
MELRALLQQHNRRDVCIKVIGTPAEEGGGGKIKLLKDGAFDGIDVCMMTHGGKMTLAHPTYIAMQAFKVEYYGKATHASASPWEGVNALDALVLAYQSIGLLRQHIHPSDRIHGIITDGGHAANIIPSYAAGTFFARSVRYERLSTELVPKLEACFTAAAEATGCTVKITRNDPYKQVKSNPALAHLCESLMRHHGFHVLPLDQQRNMARGSTDMGNVTWHCPGIHAVYAIYNDDESNRAGIHSVQFRIDSNKDTAYQRCFTMATVLAKIAYKCCVDDGFYELVKEGFHQNV